VSDRRPDARLAPAPPNGLRVAVGQSGQVGESWAARQFIEALSGLTEGYAPRITRGLRYATSGRVGQLTLRPGRLHAQVVGKEAYQVLLSIPTLSERDWHLAAETLAADPGLRARLQAGEFPPAARGVFRDCARSLIPRGFQEMSASCSCPDSRPRSICKHVIAAMYVLAYQIDRRPEALFVWRGMARDRFLTLAEGIADGTIRPFRSERQREPEPLTAQQQAALARFWLPYGDLPEIPQLTPPNVPGKLLRRQGPLPEPHNHPAITRTLVGAYEIFAEELPSREPDLRSENGEEEVRPSSV
jgi:uncharacterized Zn finger protein